MCSIAVKGLRYYLEYFAFRYIFHSAMSVYLMGLEMGSILFSLPVGPEGPSPHHLSSLLPTFVYGKAPACPSSLSLKSHDPQWQNSGRFISPSPLAAATVGVLLMLCPCVLSTRVFLLDSGPLSLKGRGQVTENFVTLGAGHVGAENILNNF